MDTVKGMLCLEVAAVLQLFCNKHVCNSNQGLDDSIAKYRVTVNGVAKEIDLFREKGKTKVDF